MAIKYLYIDDADQEGTARGLSSNENLEVVHYTPLEWDNQINYLIQNQNDFDGLIVDLRLNEFTNNEVKANYRGLALAQELRTLSTEKKELKKDIPIVLCSANNKFRESYDNDSSGHNLFDLVYEKDELSDEFKSNAIIQKMIDLAEAYQKIQSKISLEELIGGNIEIIDNRLLQILKEKLSNPAHDFLIFYNEEFVDSQGILIDEKILAARLGIDTEKSDDWDKLKEKLSEEISDFEYKGILSKGWKRWWAFSIERWWSGKCSSKSLRTTNAKERVEKLKEFSKLENIVVAEKIPKSSRESFWTICKGLNLPLDPIDGLMIAGQDDKFPWQEKEYVSYQAALNRDNIQVWKGLTPSNEILLNKIKTMYDNAKPNRQPRRR
jgi:hypothetical protein